MQALVYRTLCSVQIRHRYFLNKGEELFDDMDAPDQVRQLQGFDWRDSLRLFPIGNTQKMLKNNQLLVRQTPDSLRILVRMLDAESQQSFVSIGQEETLVFGIAYQNPLFENFTEMEFLGERRIFLANNSPALSGLDAFVPLPVDEEVFFSNSFVIDGSLFQDLLSEYGILGTPYLKGIIVLQMSGSSGEYNILNAVGTVKQMPTIFYLTFDNRKTIWKYLKPSTDFSAETLQPKPMTKSGFVTINPELDFEADTAFPTIVQFPNPSIQSLKRDEDKIISEIYL